MFYSQSGLDKILYEKYLNYKNGFFIELGAIDGIIFSNTKFFEDELNWNGILIEPTEQYKNLIINRPKCYNFNYAISKTNGYEYFLGGDAVGGLLKSMNEIHKKNWNLNEQDKMIVKCVPFYELTRDMKIDKVDLFCIDVEGGELDVLETFDWNIPVYILVIETDSNNIEKDNKCRDFLRRKGFIFDFGFGLDEVWIKK